MTRTLTHVHPSCTVRVTGTWNVAPWHPVLEAVDMATAPAITTLTELPEDTDTLRPLCVGTETPVVVHVPMPPDAVTDPLPAMPVIVTAPLLGLFTVRRRSPVVPGASLFVTVPVAARTVMDEDEPVVAAPEPAPEPLKKA